MNIAKLIRKGRLKPITKTDDHGKVVIVGYERKPGSRHEGQAFWLKTPKPVNA